VEGWIKLHRKLIENPIFLKPELLQLFIYCLLKANHEAQKIIFNGQEIEIKIGQFITGRNAMAKDLKQNPITTYKRLKILENLKILNIKSNNKFSVVTVVNYGLYQSEEIKRNTKRNNKGTTREQQGNTNKNDKNDKNDIYAHFTPPTLEEVISYCKERNNSVDPQKWYDFYSAKGWMIGKNKMKDWKAAVRTWERGCDSKPQKSKYRDMTNYQPGE
jgi:hypothetical protein